MGQASVRLLTTFTKSDVRHNLASLLAVGSMRRMMEKRQALR